MDFSTDEFLRGAFWTWLLFCAFTPYGIVASMLWSLPSTAGPGWVTGIPEAVAIVVMLTGIVAVVALVLIPVGIALTWPVARLLRRVRAVPVHLAAYTVLGAGIGLLYLTITGTLDDVGDVNTYTILIATPAVGITVATPFAWWISAFRALREDAGLLPRRPDAAEVRTAAEVGTEAP